MLLLAVRPARPLHLTPACLRMARGAALSALATTAETPLELALPLAPPAEPDSDVICTISLGEATLLSRLSKLAPSVGDKPVPTAATVDLGRRPATLLLTAAGVSFDGEGSEFVEWKFLAKLAKKQRKGAWKCYADRPPSKAMAFSELTGRTASLLPLDSLEGKPGSRREARGAAVPPTALLGGFNMHRMKGVHPGVDTDNKIAALGPRLRGSVLDICTGLGCRRRPVLSLVVRRG